MKRRIFFGVLGGAAFAWGGAAAWPHAARAQRNLPVIGILATASSTAMRPWVSSFLERLTSLGWEDGRNVVIALRFADGHRERIQDIAAEFARLKVGLIVTTGTSVPAARTANPSTPIVFALGNDPLGAGLVTNLARPGGYVTGLSQLAADLGGKRIEILREIVPSMKRLAILGDAGNHATVPEMRQVQSAAQSLGLSGDFLDVRQIENIGPAIQSLKGKAEAIYVQSGPLMNTNRDRISALALEARLPTMSGIRDYVEAGGLISYGPNFHDLFRRAADYADKILRGAKPGDLPVEQPTKFELVLNLKTAKQLDLKISDSFVLRADAVVE